MLVEGGRMRTRLPLLLVALACGAPADAATRNFGVTSFDRIRVDGPFKVIVTTGVPPSATASGTAAAMDTVAFDVQGRTLIVHTNRSSWGGYPGRSPGPVEVRIGTHELTSAWLNGSGTLAIDKVKALSFGLSVQGSGGVTIAKADVDQLNVGIAGTGSAVISGRAGKVAAVVRGVSSLDAAALTAKDATIGVEGASTVKANVSGSVKIDGKGPATITLTGGAACTTNLSGSASVSGC
jgi:hypothetical protein